MIYDLLVSLYGSHPIIFNAALLFLMIGCPLIICRGENK